MVFLPKPLGHMLTLADKESTVQHGESLLGSRRSTADRRDRAAIRTIERIHEGIWHRTKKEAINSTAPGSGCVWIKMFVIQKGWISAGHKSRVTLRDELDCWR